MDLLRYGIWGDGDALSYYVVLSKGVCFWISLLFLRSTP